jgi:Crinkler effector protein N-terminal domain
MRVPKNERINELEDAIKKTPKTFHHVEADSMDLWKVSLSEEKLPSKYLGFRAFLSEFPNIYENL